jgi:hypothetical protein
MNFAQALAEQPFSVGVGALPRSDDLIVGELSPSTQSIIARALTEGQRIALTLGSPEFQKR